MKKPLTKEKFDDCSRIGELKAYLGLGFDTSFNWNHIWKAGGAENGAFLSREEQYEAYLKWHRQYFSKLGQYLQGDKNG